MGKKGESAESGKKAEGKSEIGDSRWARNSMGHRSRANEQTRS